MAVSWTQHRFSGGLLALDTTNTVVLRGDPVRSLRSLRGPGRDRALRRRRVGVSRATNSAGRLLAVADAERSRAHGAGDPRERPTGCSARPARGGPLEAAPSARVPARLRGRRSTASAELSARRGSRSATGARPIAFEAALAVSALSLLSGNVSRRLRICPNCNWLFLDRSRNSSRFGATWRSAATAHKARRHYRRRKMPKGEVRCLERCRLRRSPAAWRARRARRLPRKRRRGRVFRDRRQAVRVQLPRRDGDLPRRI